MTAGAPRFRVVRAAFAVQPSARAIVGCDVRHVAFVRAAQDGRVGFGECAPLAGVHAERLDEAVAALECGAERGGASGPAHADALPPSARFALGCALETLGGLGASACAPVSVAAFFPGDAPALDAAAIEHLADAPVVKLKIGRADAAADHALLRRACDALPRARFRVDGNRLLALDACVARFRGLDPARFEYLEEPLRDPHDLPALRAATGIPVALDELVADPAPGAAALRDALTAGGTAVAWVLRLSRVGSPAEGRALAAVAARHGADAVLSTAYESSYTLRLAVHLAAAIPNARRAHGLGTAGVLAADACAPAVVRGGMLAGEALPIPVAERWA
jgi:O-succinylbenzoate synthase